MKLRFASWNVNNRNPTLRHIKIVRDAQADILALQEVCPALHDALAAEDVFAWDAFSLKIRPPLKSEGRSRRLGCSILGTPRFQLRSCWLIPELVFPERTIVAAVEAGDTVVTVCSFHTPPGVSWGEVKPRTLKAIAEWLTRQPSPVIFGMDANCPKTDHPDIQRNEWWWDDEPLLLGAAPLHTLRDVFRVYLANNPNELAGLVEARPNGPLAISHVRSSGRQTTECRYDFIYATPDVRIDKVTYVFDDKIREASDHALVIADLVL